MRRFALGLTVFALGCGSGAKPIQIGSILSISGDGATQDLVEAIGLALSEHNEAGGALGRPLELVDRDDASTADRGADAANELIAAGVPVVIGGVLSSITVRVSALTSAAGVVQISGASTSPLISNLDDKGYMFRTITSDVNQGLLLAKRAKAKGFTKVGVFSIPGPYGEGLASAFKTNFESGGGQVVRSIVLPGAGPYETLVNQMFESNPEAIVMIAYSLEGSNVLLDWLNKTSHASKDVFWFFTDGVEDGAFITAVGASKFTFKHEGTGPATPAGPGYNHFLTSFEAKYARPPGSVYAVNFYDAAHLAVLSMLASGASDGASIKGQMGAVSKGGEAFGPGELAALRAAIAAGKDVNYQGASGNVDFDDKGDVANPYDIWQVKNATFTATETNVSP
jgi:branched-chain amino acid transport system substrate-binding protein